jgi:hypothetical protein
VRAGRTHGLTRCIVAEPRAERVAAKVTHVEVAKGQLQRVHALTGGGAVQAAGGGGGGLGGLGGAAVGGAPAAGGRLRAGRGRRRGAGRGRGVHAGGRQLRDRAAQAADAQGG